MPAIDSSAIAQRVIERWQSASTDLEVWKTYWQDIATYIQPRKASITTKTSTPEAGRHEQLFTSEAIRCNQILANGMVSMMTPVQSPWFSYEPPAYLRNNDRVAQWMKQCTEIIQGEMSRSNFYTEVHEMFLDRGGFGTSGMHVEEGKKSLLNFTTLGIGSYVIFENDEGYVEGLARKMPMKIRQAVAMFGEENLSPATRKIIDENKPGEMEKEICILHEISPRPEKEREAGKIGMENLPIASIYVEEQAKHLIQNGGYYEMPSFVSRYLKWGDGYVWGWSPAWYALPDARQLNFLEKMLDALAEKAAFPPFIAPASFEGVVTVDVRANGVTYADQAEAQILREWQATGRYDVGKDRVEDKRNAIREGFHVDLFRMFSDYEGTMTAYEASLRQSEKIMQFSPTNTRLTTEFFNPLLQRVWGICVRAGILPPPPEEAIQQSGDGEAYLAEPDITYSSPIALAIKAIETQGFLRTLEFALNPALLQVRPDVLDNFDLDAGFRDLARNNGTPARLLLDVEQRDAVRQARAEQQAAMIQVEQGKMASETLRNVADAGSKQPGREAA